MDTRITVKFFRITPEYGACPPFEQALQAAFDASPTPVKRQQTLPDGVIVRLERFAEDDKHAGYYDGEIIRRQAANFPLEASDSGLAPLPLGDGNGLGHSIAFRYNASLQVLAVQFDNRAVSVSRLLAYLKSHNASADYVARPLVRQDAWSRYNRGRPRKLILSIANPTDLPAVEGEVTNAAESSRRLSEIYHAPHIKLEISMGNRAGSLLPEKVEQAINFFTRGPGREADVRNLSVVVRPEDGSGSDPVDFIEEILAIKGTVALPDNDPKTHYLLRRDFVGRSFTQHIDYIRQVYGDEQ